MDKHKIIVFSTAYFPYVGGAEIAIENIAKRLNDRFDFLILTPLLRRDLPRREIRPEGKVIRIGTGSRLDKYLLIFYGLFCRKKADLVLGVDLSQGSVAAAMYKFFHPSTPFIFNIQFGESEERLERGRFGIISLMFRFILGQADHVTAISSYLLDLAKRYGYKGRGMVIHNGVDIEKFTKHNAQSTNKTRNVKHKTIITVSRLVKKNGIDILINAMAEAKNSFSDIQCHIIGDGPERKNLELQTTSHKLQANIKFFGSIPHEKIPEYLHEADVFVRPSRSEGMGNSFVEALATGLPIVGTPVGGITDIIEDGKTGFFAKSEDTHDLAERIVYVLKNPDKARSTTEIGGKMVEARFSWGHISSAYAEVFRGAVDNLRLLIATPLLPPQLGGPAIYAKNLSEEFTRSGFVVGVVSFGGFLRYPSGLRHFLYFLALLRYALSSQIIFALDYTSVGFPAACVALILRKPLIIRVEGDFLWESYIERVRKDITLAEFYKRPQELSVKERITRSVSGWVMRRADRLVFSSDWRRRMIIDAYKISFEKTCIIRNAYPSAGSALQGSGNKFFLWAGRMLYLKNLERLIRAFAGTSVSSYKLHLVGEGPEKIGLERLIKELRAGARIKIFSKLDHAGLMEKIASASLVVLPSLSDVGPNIVAEAIGSGVRVIMTEESGFAEYFPGLVKLIDPLDEKELRKELEASMRESAPRVLPAFKPRSWEETAYDWIKLFREI